jgi:excisionase family DNA binding protein
VETRESKIQEAASEVKLLLTPEEAAHSLSISRTLLFRLLAHQEIQSIKLSGLQRIPRWALAEYVSRLCDSQKAG